MSTMTTYTQYIRWSDVLEQDVTQQAQENWEPVSVISEDQDKGKTVFHRAARATANSLVNMAQRLNRLRAHSMRHNGYW